MLKLLKENDQYNVEISVLKQELETTKRECEQQCSKMESQTLVGTFRTDIFRNVLFHWPGMM